MCHVLIVSCNFVVLPIYVCILTGILDSSHLAVVGKRSSCSTLLTRLSSLFLVLTIFSSFFLSLPSLLPHSVSHFFSVVCRQSPLCSDSCLAAHLQTFQCVSDKVRPLLASPSPSSLRTLQCVPNFETSELISFERLT